MWWNLDRLANAINLVHQRPRITGRITEQEPSTAVQRLRKAQRALELGVNPDLVVAVLSEPSVSTAITRMHQAMPLAWRHLPGL